MRPEEKRNFGNILPGYGAATRGGVGLADQAEGLRRLVGTRSRPARVVAVTSGKTNVAVNLAIALAQCQKRVVLIDLDLGLANADILLDMTPRYNLSNVIGGHRTVEEVLTPAMGGIQVVPGASGVERLANLNDLERTSLISSFETLHRLADFILLDTGAGISRNTTAFLSAADDIIVVTMPEPPAIIDAYAVIKMLAKEPDHGDLFVLMNQTNSREEAERYANGISVTANKLLNAYVDKLGYIVSDARVAAAVRQRRPFLLAYPTSQASECIRSIARRMAFARSGEVSNERPGFIRRLWTALKGS
jgi:flagellar biosynthesis protein FlhG